MRPCSTTSWEMGIAEAFEPALGFPEPQKAKVHAVSGFWEVAVVGHGWEGGIAGKRAPRGGEGVV